MFFIKRNWFEGDFPFCVMDMMRDSTSDLVTKLFLAYKGDNKDVQEYKERILNPLVKSGTTNDTFNILAIRLKKQFDFRIQEYLGNNKQKDFTMLTASYWKNVRDSTNKSRLSDYYLRTASCPNSPVESIRNLL